MDTEMLEYVPFDAEKYHANLAHEAYEKHSQIHSLSFSDTGTWLAAATSTGLVALWNVALTLDGRSNGLGPVATFQACKGAVHSVKLTNNLIVCGTEGAVKIFRLDDVLSAGVSTATPAPLLQWQPFPTTGYDINGLQLTDSQIFAACEDGGVYSVDMAVGETVTVYKGHEGPVLCVAQRQCGQLASGSLDGTVKFWDPNTASCITTLTSPPVRGATSSLSTASKPPTTPSNGSHRLQPPTSRAQRSESSPKGHMGASPSKNSHSPSPAMERNKPASSGKNREVRLQLANKQWVPSLVFDDTDTLMATGGLQGPFVWDLSLQQVTFAAKSTTSMFHVCPAVAIANDCLLAGQSGRKSIQRWSLLGQSLGTVPVSVSSQRAIAVSPGQAQVVAVAGEGPKVDIIVAQRYKTQTLQL